MKKITLILCLLFAISIGMIYSQTMQVPAAIVYTDNTSDNLYIGDRVLPDASKAKSNITSHQADKLTMLSSPNPFTNRTMVTCFIPVKGKFVLGIRNMFGETVKTIENIVDREGSYNIEVTSEHLRPGIYTAILVLKTSNDVMMKTIRLVYNQ